MRGIALCGIGLEKTSARELARLGFDVEDRRAGMVRFSLGASGLGTSLAAVNMGARTVDRVLLELGSFPAPDFDAYYEGLASLPWEMCCYKDTAVSLDRVRSRRSQLSAQTSLQAMGQKAIYERLMRHYRLSSMPETGNTVAVRVYLDQDECVVGVDTSGDPLHKRGYRIHPVAAPLKETVAASLLFLSGWNRKHPLLDPFCGSGTIAIEAALYALDFAPGLSRRFAFESMPAVSRREVEAVREALESKIRNDVEFRIVASDIDPKAISRATLNAREAGIADWIEFSAGRAEDSEPFGQEGFLIANPPYGNRLGTVEEAKALYASLGSMRDRFSSAGWGFGFITNSEDFGEDFGLEGESSTKIINGSEEQWFHWFPPSRGDHAEAGERKSRKK